jgi:hypothetical protein
MRRFRRISIALAAPLMFGSVSVSAQDEISREIQPLEQFRFDATQGVTAQWDNVLLGPYTGTLLSDPTQPTLTLYCVDFIHSIGYGNVVNVNTLNIGDDGTNLSTTEVRLKDAVDLNPGGIDSRLMQYRQAAFLAAMFESYADLGTFNFDSNGALAGGETTFGAFGSGDTRRNVWSGIHAAIWSIMTPGFPGSVGGINDIDLAMAMALPFINLAQDASAGIGSAATAFAEFDFSEWSVLTDVNADGQTGGKQEFLVRTTVPGVIGVNVVPEPATVVLLLSGFLILFGVGRKRFGELGATDT